MNRYIFAILALTLTGCAFAPSGGVKLNPGAGNIKIGSDRPPSYYVSTGSVQGTDGGGCGYYGYFGTRGNAINNLLNEASIAGAEYVVITSEQGSYKSMSCETNLYKISAIGYREDANLKAEAIARKSISEQENAKKQQQEAIQLMAGFIEACKAMGFKPETDGMGMCLLTQQSRYDAQVGRDLQQKLAQDAVEAQRDSQLRSEIATEQAAQINRAAQQDAAIQNSLQNSIKNAFPVQAPPTQTNCNTVGSNIRCTSY